MTEPLPPLFDSDNTSLRPDVVLCIHLPGGGCIPLGDLDTINRHVAEAQRKREHNATR